MIADWFLRRVKRHHLNAAIYLGVSVVSRGASLLLIPLYTSRLSRADYASFGLCQTLFWLLPPLVSLALATALGRFYFDHREKAPRDRALGAIAITMVALSLCFGVLLEIVLDVTPPLGRALLGAGIPYPRLVLWTCACLPLVEIPSMYFRASESATRFAVLNMSVFALTAGSTVYFMMARGLGLAGLLGGMLVGQLGGAAFAVAFTLTRLIPSLSRTLIREAIAYSVPFIPHLIGNSLMVGADRWALEFFGFRDDLGLYTLATQLTIPVLLATSAWNEASSPRYFAAWRDGGDEAARAELPRVVAGFVVCGGGALAAVLLAMPILRLLVGARFRASFPLVPWIGISLCVGALFSAFVNVLQLRKTTRLIPVLTFGSVLVNVALNFMLVPNFGVYGAIAATGLAYAFRSALMFVFAMRALRSTPIRAALTGDGGGD